MHTIIKLIGVTPGALSHLHAKLDAPDMRTQEGHYWYDGTLDPSGRGIVPYAVVIDSRFHSESNTYTVSLRFNLIIKHQDKSFFYPPLSALDEIFKSIDPRLLPDTKAVELETARAAAEDALAERISAEILGQACWYDIANGTGELIVAANYRITRSQIRQLVSNIANLRLVPSDTDDPVIRALIRIQDERKSAQQG